MLCRTSRSLAHSFACLLFRSFYLFIRSFVRSLVRSFVHHTHVHMNTHAHIPNFIIYDDGIRIVYGHIHIQLKAIVCVVSRKSMWKMCVCNEKEKKRDGQTNGTNEMNELNWFCTVFCECGCGWLTDWLALHTVHCSVSSYKIVHSSSLCYREFHVFIHIYICARCPSLFAHIFGRLLSIALARSLYHQIHAYICVYSDWRKSWWVKTGKFSSVYFSV